MRTPIKFAVLGALGFLAGTTAFAQPSPGDDADTPPGGPPRDRPGFNRPDPERHRQMLIEKYDANKDGKLDDTELLALGRDVFEAKLPPPGRGPAGPGMRAGREIGPPESDDPGFGPRQRRGSPGDGPRDFVPPGPRRADSLGTPPGPMPGRGGREREGGFDHPPFGPGPRGFGPPNSEEGRRLVEEHRREFLKRYDTDNDGKLSSSEREAIGRDIEEGKLPPPPPPVRRDGPVNTR